MVIPAPRLSLRRFDTIEEVCSALQRLFETQNRSASPILALDLDGTLWRGDLGYASLEHAERTGVLTAAHQPSLAALRRIAGAHYAQESITSFVRRFERSRRPYPLMEGAPEGARLGVMPDSAEVAKVCELFCCCASVFYGISRGILSAVALTVLQGGAETKEDTQPFQRNPFALRPDVAQIRALASRFNSIELVVTATASVFAQEAAERIGICRSRIRGVELGLCSGDSPLPVVEPVPMHRGKGQVVQRWGEEIGLNERPFLALGDSPLVTDFGLLLVSDYFLDVSGDGYVLAHNRAPEPVI